MTADTWEKFSSRMRELRHLESIAGLLGWDEQTYMPPKAAPGRAAAMGTLASIEHERLTRRRSTAASSTSCSFRILGPNNGRWWTCQRARNKAVKLPSELVREMAELASSSQTAWVQARTADDFSIFEPLLQRTLDLKARQAEHLGYEKEPYDAHLDLFERGATAEQLQPMFDSVTAGITPTLEAVLEREDGTRRLAEAALRPR